MRLLLRPDTSKRTSPYLQPNRTGLDLFT